MPHPPCVTSVEVKRKQKPRPDGTKLPTAPAARGNTIVRGLVSTLVMEAVLGSLRVHPIELQTEEQASGGYIHIPTFQS